MQRAGIRKDAGPAYLAYSSPEKKIRAQLSHLSQMPKLALASRQD
jgi:hypothetical protein